MTPATLFEPEIKNASVDTREVESPPAKETGNKMPQAAGDVTHAPLTSDELRERRAETDLDRRSVSRGGHPVAILEHRTAVPKNQGGLGASFDAIQEVASSTNAGAWLEAAAVLKRDAIRFRRSSRARHASVLLAFADALTFTSPRDEELSARAFDVVPQILAVLTEPFIAQQAEEDLLVGLLTYGWNLAPVSSGDPLEG